MKERKPAIKLAAELLGNRDFSAAEMRERLVQRGYSEEESLEAVRRLLQLGLISETGDDAEALKAAAAEWLRKREKGITPSSLRSLGAYLVRKGFEEGLVMEYLECAARAAGLAGPPPEAEEGE